MAGAPQEPWVTRWMTGFRLPLTAALFRWARLGLWRERPGPEIGQDSLARHRLCSRMWAAPSSSVTASTFSAAATSARTMWPATSTQRARLDFAGEGLLKTEKGIFMLDNDKALIALSGKRKSASCRPMGQPPWTDLRRDRHRQERGACVTMVGRDFQLAWRSRFPGRRVIAGDLSGAWPCSGKIHGKTGATGSGA